MTARAKSKTRHFAIIEIGGRSGLHFSFQLLKIAILDLILEEIK